MVKLGLALCVAAASVALCVGCSTPAVDIGKPDIVRGAIALSLALHQSAPQPTPAPDDGECSNCGGQGWLGDGRIKMDCPDCDLDPLTTSPNPLAAFAFPSPVGGELTLSSPAPTPPKPATQDANALKQDASASVGGVDDFVVDTPRKRITFLTLPSCGPCRTFERRVLADPLVVDELERWWSYQGKVDARAVVPVPKAVPRMRVIEPDGSMFDFTPSLNADEFLQQLRGMR